MRRTDKPQSAQSSKSPAFAILAADTVLFTLNEGKLLVRLIPVNIPPFFKDLSGLPGGLLKPEEIAEQAALRHLETKGKISAHKVYIEQLYTFSKINRDPRGRVVAVAYLALVPWENLSEEERTGSDEAYWQTVGITKLLAYDHTEILKTAIERLSSKITYTNLISKLLPKEFTLTELENAYQAILGTEVDKRNFRKKVLKLGLVKPLSKERRGLKQRPAKLYSFSTGKIVSVEVL
jgi:8-oxo-dGTP diphosphatase